MSNVEPEGWNETLVRGKEGMWRVSRVGLVSPSICTSALVSACSEPRSKVDNTQLTLKNRIRLSPPATAPTGTAGLGCQAKSTTPLPAPDASRFPAVGFIWFAFLCLCISMEPWGSGPREVPISEAGESSMNDLVEVKRDDREGTPFRVRLSAHSGRGWRRSNLHVRCNFSVIVSWDVDYAVCRDSLLS